MGCHSLECAMLVAHAFAQREAAVTELQQVLEANERWQKANTCLRTDLFIVMEQRDLARAQLREVCKERDDARTCLQADLSQVMQERDKAQAQLKQREVMLAEVCKERNEYLKADRESRKTSNILLEERNAAFRERNEAIRGNQEKADTIKTLMEGINSLRQKLDNSRAREGFNYYPTNPCREVNAQYMEYPTVFCCDSKRKNADLRRQLDIAKAEKAQCDISCQKKDTALRKVRQAVFDAGY